MIVNAHCECCKTFESNDIFPQNVEVSFYCNYTDWRRRLNISKQKRKRLLA